MSGNNKAADRKSTWMLIKENILHKISDGFICILSYKGKRKEFFQGYEITTNNRMELMAVIKPKTSSLNQMEIKNKLTHRR